MALKTKTHEAIVPVLEQWLDAGYTYHAICGLLTKALLEIVLRRANNNISRAAIFLSVHRNTMTRLMKINSVTVRK
jgi:DNA-binding protein Fis